MDDEFAQFYKEFSAIEESHQPKDCEEVGKIGSTTMDSNNSEAIDLTLVVDEVQKHVHNCSEGADISKSLAEKRSDSSTLLHMKDAQKTYEHTKADSASTVETKNSPLSQIDEEPKSGSTDNISVVDGERIYTNLETKEEFSWSESMQQWVPRGYNPVFDGTSYRYTDKNGTNFKWNSEKASWEKHEAKEGPDKTYKFDGENYTYTDPNDNTTYLWDVEKSAWFPKVDDDFMARYQMSYGFVDNTTKDEPAQEDETSTDNKRKAPAPPSWFDLDDAHNTKVYVSNLPSDITEQDFVDFMQKCGLVLKDMKTNKYKVKLYKEPDGTLKGDALCDYIKIESVELALNVLDGSDFRGKKVSVQRAKFQMKGDYNPTLKPKKKRKNEKEKEKKMREKLLDWRPDKLRGEREKHERTVVVKNLFTPSLFDESVELILEYTEDIRSEANKCGTVRKVTLYDKNPEGVATVTFSDAEEADICVKFFDNRWFGKRKIIAETWDGKTKYKVAESEAESRERLDKWNKFLEDEERVKQ